MRVRERVASSVADAAVRVPHDPAEFAGETDLVDAALVSSTPREIDPEDAELVRRPDCDARSVRAATAGESKGIIGSLVLHVPESSLPNSDNSSMGVVCVEAASAVVALAPGCHLLVHLLPVLLVLCTRVALCHPCMMHMHIIRGRTRSAHRVPGGGRGAKRG